MPFSNNKHIEFIQEYFKLAGKEQALTEFFPNGETKFSRAKHSNSIFFLGCIFYKYLVPDKKPYTVREHDHFCFLWFLISLSHDFSFDTEAKSHNEQDDLFNLEHKLLESSYKDEIFKDIPIKSLIDSIKPYFEYRKSQCKNDHGIYAGLRLFDTLVKNRIIREENQNNGVETNNLYWGEEVEPLYYLACIAIAIHNIWMPNKDKEDEYQKNDLNDLIDLEKISFNTFPFYVLLCIVDTIDPIKIYSCCNSEYVLENILINFEATYTIAFQNKEESGLDFNKLIEKAKELEKWLAVKVTSENNTCVTIKLLESEALK